MQVSFPKLLTHVDGMQYWESTLNIVLSECSFDSYQSNASIILNEPRLNLSNLSEMAQMKNLYIILNVDIIKINCYLKYFFGWYEYLIHKLMLIDIFATY
jgi:hypothetical protein